MPIFIAKVSVGGRTTQVTLPASSRADAERQLKRRGRVISLKRQGLFDLQPGLSPYERYMFLVKLSTMIASKVSIGKALELMGEAFTGNIRRVSRNLSERVNGGVNFITAIEAECGREAVKNFLPMQPGDVPATWADASLLKSLTGYAPQTPFREGVARFVAWYRDYYRV